MNEKMKLPRPTMRRWSAERKKAVIDAIDSGLCSGLYAMRVYNISPEELEIWRENLTAFGLDGLRLKNIQKNGVIND